MNTFGRILRLTTFGESHGPAIGGVLDGFPAGLDLDLQQVQQALDHRNPSQAVIGSGRQETDQVEFLSGIRQGKSLGSPIAFLIRNRDARSEDYAVLEHAFRPGHADDTWQAKYGIRDYRGGGRASARETAVRVAGGALARQLLAGIGLRIYAYASRIGEICLEKPFDQLDKHRIYEYPSRCPDAVADKAMLECLQRIRQEGDSIGGVVECRVTGMPKGLGEPVYDKLTARLASAMMSINAARGFEIGRGFEAARMKGSEHNDLWNTDGTTCRNLCGGVRGGISTGEDLVFRVAFKPIPTIAREQALLVESETLSGKAEGMTIEKASLPGRHDVCCVPRAVSVVEAMTALVLADMYLLNRCSRGDWPED